MAQQAGIGLICVPSASNAGENRPLSIEDFAVILPPSAAILGLDVGTKTVGLAISDVTRSIATPLHTLRRTKFAADAAALLALVATRDARGFIIGLPVNFNGSEGPRAQSCRAFARNLGALTPLPIAFWDERLSTAAAERALLLADASRKRRAEVIDAVAAGFILQGALDRMKNLGAARAGREQNGGLPDGP